MSAIDSSLPTRHVTVDILRVVSAFGIVCFHSRFQAGNFGEIFYAGLVCFIIISVWFCLKAERQSAKQHFSRMTRIMVPWLFWSAVFVLKDVVITGRDPIDIMLPLRLWAGTALHLWYVMFLVTVMTAIWWLRTHLQLEVLQWGAWVAIALLTLTAENWRAWSMSMPAPLPQYAHALFPVFAGIVLYCDFSRGRFFGTALAMLAAIYLAKFHGVGLPYLVGLGLCIVAFGLADRLSSKATIWLLLADCMYGVYLIHPLLYYPWRKIMSEHSLVYPACVFGTATAIVLVAKLQKNMSIHMLFGVRPRTTKQRSAG